MYFTISKVNRHTEETVNHIIYSIIQKYYIFEVTQKKLKKARLVDEKIQLFLFIS